MESDKAEKPEEGVASPKSIMTIQELQVSER
jgi:hypothetical protein